MTVLILITEINMALVFKTETRVWSGCVCEAGI